MRSLFPAVLFLAAYSGMLLVIAFLDIVFLDPGDEAFIGIGGFFLGLIVYFYVAALAGSVGVSLAGLSSASRFRLGSLFILAILLAAALTLVFFKVADHELLDAFWLPFLAILNISLAFVFLRVAYAKSRIKAAV